MAAPAVQVVGDDSAIDARTSLAPPIVRLSPSAAPASLLEGCEKERVCVTGQATQGSTFRLPVEGEQAAGGGGAEGVSVKRDRAEGGAPAPLGTVGLSERGGSGPRGTVSGGLREAGRQKEKIGGRAQNHMRARPGQQRQGKRATWLPGKRAQRCWEPAKKHR